jgi:hypothetical protein
MALLGTWCICATCVAVYLPVHLDIRYLVPLIPLHCLLGATLCHAYFGDGRLERRSHATGDIHLQRRMTS